MTTLFADTYYFIALLSLGDKDHARATEFTRNFTGRMLTTGWVLMELADGGRLLANRLRYSSSSCLSGERYPSFLPIIRTSMTGCCYCAIAPTRNGR